VAGALKALAGFAEHGLFLNLAERVLIETDEGVITFYP
jgi:ribose 5-phosphate isomerase